MKTSMKSKKVRIDIPDEAPATPVAIQPDWIVRLSSCSERAFETGLTFGPGWQVVVLHKSSATNYLFGVAGMDPRTLVAAAVKWLKAMPGDRRIDDTTVLLPVGFGL